jgi:hypothetical protein
MSIIFLLFIFIYIYIYRERERERERESRGGSERHCIGGGWSGKQYVTSVQKVPSQCPLVLLIGVKHMIRINSEFNFYGGRGVTFERNLIRD